MIAEGANGPVHPDADEVFDKNGQIVLPDILVNAGGVTASYFEWAQNRQHYRWDLKRVRQELESVLTKSFEQVWDLSKQRKISCAPPRILSASKEWAVRLFWEGLADGDGCEP